MTARRIARPLSVLLAALAVTVTLPGSTLAAAAAPSPCPSGERLQCIKTRSATAVSDRETTLAGLVTIVDKAADLTPSDRTALLSLLHADETGLTQLEATIQADTTVVKAASDAAKIVTAYRVYVLAVPQVHLVVATDRIGAIDARLHTLSGKLQAAIEASRAGSEQKAQARARLADFDTQVAAADRDVDGLSSAILSLTPAGYPGNRTQLGADRDRVNDARVHLQAARADAHAILALIKPAT